MVKNQKIPVVALIGPPNSGKSTLLNKLIGEKKAITAREAHTTRDLNVGETDWQGMYFQLIDTGGLVPDAKDKIEKSVQVRSWSAIAQADLLVLVLERKIDPDTFPQEIMQRIWKTGKPFILVINKVDDPNLDKSEAEFAQFGAKHFLNISCNTGYGFDKLADLIVDNLLELGFEPNFERDLLAEEEIIKPKKGRKKKLVSKAKDGDYYVVRNEEGLFESITEPGTETLNEETEEVIETIIFDLYDVLFENGISQITAKLKAEYGLDENQTLAVKALHEKKHFLKDIEVERFSTELAKILGLEGFNYQNHHKEWFKEIPENIEVANFLKEQKALGKKIYYLSNISTSLEYRRLSPVFKFFDGGLDSGSAGVSKPNPRIYQKLVDKFKLNPEKCLFIDDRLENLSPALSMGMKVIHYKQGITNLDAEYQELLGRRYRIPQILFLGRPNVGKSSLFNAMVGKDIQIVTDIAGTTMSVSDTLIEKKISKTLEFPEKKYLIFDLDGVLVDGLESDLEAEKILLSQSGKTIKEIEKGFWDYFEKPNDTNSQLNLEKIKSKEYYLQQIAKLRLAHPKGKAVFEDFIEELKHLDLSQTKLGVVTSSSQIFLKALLKSIDLPIEYALGFEDSPSKIEKISQICKNWEISPNQVYYFTDTKIDVLELKSFLQKDKLLGCSWGYQGQQKLAEVLDKKQILNDFEDIHKHIFPTSFTEKIFKIEKYLLLDSVGIRKPGQQTFGSEKFGTFRTIEAAHRADVICLVLDGSQKISHQDQVVAGIAKEARKGLVVILNKADLVSPAQRVKFIHEFNTKFNFLKVDNFIWVSAKEAMEEAGLKLETVPEKKSKTKKISSRIEVGQDVSFEHPIENFILDLGGVVFRHKHLQIIDFLEQEFGLIDGRNYRSERLFTDLKKSQVEIEGEIIETLSFWVGLVKELNLETKISAQEMFEKYLEANETISYTLEFIHSQKLQGRKIYYLTNSSRWLLTERLKNPIMEFFDGGLASFQVESYKPDVKIYKALLEKYEIDPVTCCFVDDDLENVEVARKLGMKGIWFKEDKENLERKLELLEKNRQENLAKKYSTDLIRGNLEQIWEVISESINQREQIISKERLRRLFNYITKQKPPNKLKAKKKAIIYDLLYTSSRPPTFELLVKDRSTIHWSYIRFLENLIRNNFEFNNNEIKVKLTEINKKKILSY